jgi:hypothetical protein
MGVAMVTGGGGGAGACVDGLQPVDKMPKTAATRQTGLKNLFKDLVNFNEREPDSVLSEKNEVEARRKVFAATVIGIIVVEA